MLFRKSKPSEAPDKAAAAPAPAPAPEPVPLPVPVPIAGDAKAKEGYDLAPVRTTDTEDIVYPSGLRLGLLLTSVFVSMFLVALVSMLSIFFFLTGGLETDGIAGPLDHHDRYSTDHGRLQVRHRYWLVRLCISLDDMRLPTAIRKALLLLQHQGHLPDHHHPL